MDSLYYYGDDLKSAVPNGADIPKDAYNILIVDMKTEGIDGSYLPYIEWTSEGFTNLEEGKAAKESAERKEKQEAAAYAQQDSFFTPNKRHLFDGVVYNAPPADMEQLPKMQCYRVFMQALWTEYHVRIQSGSDDYDYSSFAPSQEYSYVELEQEWAEYNQVTT